MADDAIAALAAAVGAAALTLAFLRPYKEGKGSILSKGAATKSTNSKRMTCDADRKLLAAADDDDDDDDGFGSDCPPVLEEESSTGTYQDDDGADYDYEEKTSLRSAFYSDDSVKYWHEKEHTGTQVTPSDEDGEDEKDSVGPDQEGFLNGVSVNAERGLPTTCVVVGPHNGDDGDDLCNALSALNITDNKTPHAAEAASMVTPPMQKQGRSSLLQSSGDDTDFNKGRYSDSTDLCDALSALTITADKKAAKEEEEEGEDSYEDRAAKAVGARLTDGSRSVPLGGGHAHALLACWVGRLLDETDARGGDEGDGVVEIDGGVEVIPEAAIEALMGTGDGRGDENRTLEEWRKVFRISKNRKKLLTSSAVKSLSTDGRERLLAYLRDGRCSLGGAVGGPWYEARDLAACMPLWPEDAGLINSADVCQGDIDDCYFATGLSLVAEHYPGCIRKRIERIVDDDESGMSRFVVRHWSERRGGCVSTSPKSRMGPMKTEVGGIFYVHRRVNRKGGPGTPLYCRSRSGALYPMVLERAWQKHRCRGDGGSYEGIVNENCMEAEAVMHFLTGLKFVHTELPEDSSTQNGCRSPPSQQRQDLIWGLVCSALRKGRAVSAGTYATGSGGGKKLPDEWANRRITAHHNYALLDAGKDAEHGRFVVLRNPHGKELSPFLLPNVATWPSGANGTKDGPELSEDGVFRLNLSEFFCYFKTISCANETCEDYPIRQCHRYRPFFADCENIQWCYEAALDGDDENETASGRRLDFDESD